MPLIKLRVADLTVEELEALEDKIVAIYDDDGAGDSHEGEEDGNVAIGDAANTSTGKSLDISRKDKSKETREIVVREKDNLCSACGEESSDLKACGACLSVQYCSEECQKRHWNEMENPEYNHSQHCDLLARVTEAIERDLQPSESGLFSKIELEMLALGDENAGSPENTDIVEQDYGDQYDDAGETRRGYWHYDTWSGLWYWYYYFWPYSYYYWPLYGWRRWWWRPYYRYFGRRYWRTGLRRPTIGYRNRNRSRPRLPPPARGRSGTRRAAVSGAGRAGSSGRTGQTRTPSRGGNQSGQAPGGGQARGSSPGGGGSRSSSPGGGGSRSSSPGGGGSRSSSPGSGGSRISSPGGSRSRGGGGSGSGRSGGGSRGGGGGFRGGGGRQ